MRRLNRLIDVAIITAALFLAAGDRALAADRAELRAGADPGAELILDAVRVVRGGDEVGNAYMGKLSLTLDLDSAEAGLREGTHARFNVLATFGDSLASLAGDLQVASNIEAPDGVRLFEAWVEQSLGGHASILAGWNDFNAEFDVTTVASGLLNSSFGVGPDISQVGPSIFPRSYPGLRFRASGESGAYAIAGAWGGVPYPVAHPVSGDETEGTFEAVEAGWTRASYRRLGSPKLCAGYWRFEADESAISPDDDAIGGFYTLAEGEVELAGGARVGGFLRAGRALDSSRPIRRYVGGGVRFASIAKSRPEDEVTLGIARAQLSPAKSAEIGAGSETTFELNWTVRVNASLALVPDVQYVKAPGGSADARNALIFGVRAVITYE